MKKLSVVLALVLVFALAVPTFANPFTDVPADHWAYEAINKLVAAGIIEGYPDGTFKGQRELTRYEIAVMVGRLLEDLEEERAELAEELENAQEGLNTAQAQDVTAIVKALIEKNMPEPQKVELPEGLTDEQAEEVASLIEALTFEYQAELKVLGQKLDVVTGDIEDMDAYVKEMEARIAALENAEPVVSFSGSYAVDFEHQNAEGDVIDNDADLNYYYVDVDEDINEDGDVDIDDQKEYMADVNDWIKNWLDDNPDKGFADAVAAFNTEVKNGTYDYKILEETSPVDPYVTVPWTAGAETVTVNQTKDFSHTLTFKTNINKDGFSAVLDVAAADDADEFAVESIGLTLENDFLKGTYNEANTVSFKDYAYNEKDIDGVTVDFKKYGINTFFGIKEVAVNDTESTDTLEDTLILDDGSKVTVEKDYVKFEEDENQLTKMTEGTVDYYAYGVEKSFAFAGTDLNVNVAGERKKDDEDAMKNILGFAASNEIVGMNVDFDLAYMMDKENDLNDYMYRLGLARDLGLASVDFNYKSRGKDFNPIDSDATIYDAGDDNYDLFTTGLGTADMSGWNVTVKPQLFEALDASVFYASVDNGSENTKLALNGEMPLFLEGLTVSSKYEDVDEAGDETKTTGFGAKYTFLGEKATATFDYTVVDPVEDALPNDPGMDAVEKENTTKLGLEYAMNDYVSADFSYENVANLGHVKSYMNEDMTKTTTSFGVDLTDYPVFGALTVSAGLGYDQIAGYEYVDYDETAEHPVDDPADISSLEEKATELSLGLGYTLGSAELSYDLTNTTKEGEGVTNGTYRTHKLGLTYPILEGTDLVTSYEVLNFNAEDDAKDFKVQTISSGVSVAF